MTNNEDRNYEVQEDNSFGTNTGIVLINASDITAMARVRTRAKKIEVLEDTYGGLLTMTP